MIDKLIEVAKGEIGVCEPSGDDKYITYYNKVGGMNFSMDVAWCAIFVTWCKGMAGIGKDIIPDFASCDMGMNWFKKNNLWEKSRAYGGEYEPKAGDIVFFSSKYDENDSTHVGIVTGLSGNAVLTIEGNTSNKVAKRSYSVASKYILGYATPAYAKCEEKHDTYTVKKGDSLWKIAKEKLGSGTRYVEIMKLNNMENSVIYPGNVLYLPE